MNLFFRMRLSNNVHSKSTTRNKCAITLKIFKKRLLLWDIKFFDSPMHTIYLRVSVKVNEKLHYNFSTLSTPFFRKVNIFTLKFLLLRKLFHMTTWTIFRRKECDSHRKAIGSTNLLYWVRKIRRWWRRRRHCRKKAFARTKH